MLLSLCMIVKDEEYFLGRHLPTMRPYFDEIIIADTGSSDGTLALLNSYVDRVLELEWQDDFSLARNACLEAASGEWVLVLDADELITGEDLQAIRDMLPGATGDAFRFRRFNYNDNALQNGWQPGSVEGARPEQFSGFTTHDIVRLVRASAGWRFRGKVHELLEAPEGGGADTEIGPVIHHYETGNPKRSKQDREIEYLRLMEQDLAESTDGRLLETSGHTYMNYAEEFTKAASCFRRCLELDYDVGRNTENLAEALYRDGQFTEARKLYERRFSEGSRGLALCLNLGNLRNRAGEPEGALITLLEARKFCTPGTQLYQNIDHNIRYLKRQTAG